ncbi:hypothetical protein [uncultured Enterovirga sp.]|uniref:hypothetical protein n=1 Tax=uncultured Enterovirga sp. TaxID=2026352 RepID=UPI0035CB3E13
MILRVLITLSVALFPAAATAVTPERSQAVTIAARTGEVIGAAAACGVPEAELVELGPGSSGGLGIPLGMQPS